MYYIYVLRSLRTGKRYVGYTSKLPEQRLQEHNSGSNKFTSAHCPYSLIYYESLETKKDAIIREKFFKSGQGRKQLDNMPL
jgi:putative endonuclease